MAERRDLQIAILSDVDQFDTSRAASDLEQLADASRDLSDQIKDSDDTAARAEQSLESLGDSARDTARDLDRVGDAAKDTGRDTRAGLDDVERATDDAARSTRDYADETEQTARKVDDAFDRIAKASRSSTRKVDDDVDRAKRGMDDLKDEAGQSGREAAASFSGGFDDIVDFVQEVGANAFAGFGAFGAAAGIAAAAGVGILYNQLEQAAEKANETKDRIIALAAEIVDAGGDFRNVDIVEQVRSWSDEIADNKSWWELWQESNTTNLEKVRDAAKRTGVDVEDMFLAMSGVDAEAGARVLDEITRKIEDQRDALADHSREVGYNAEQSDAQTLAYVDQIAALEDQRDAIKEALGVTDDAIERAQLLKGVTEDLVAEQEAEARAAEDAAAAQEVASRAREEAADLIGSFIDPLEAYNEALEETGDRHAETIDGMIEDLREQVEAQVSWADNLQELARRGVDEGVLEQLARLGPEGAPMVQELTDASDAKLNEWTDLMGTKARVGVNDRFIASLIDGQPGVETAGQGLGQSAVDGIESKQGAVERAAAGVRRAMVNELAGSPIRVDVDVNGPSRSTLYAIRSTITSSLTGITVPVHPAIMRNERYRP